MYQAVFPKPIKHIVALIMNNIKTRPGIRILRNPEDPDETKKNIHLALFALKLIRVTFLQPLSSASLEKTKS